MKRFLIFLGILAATTLMAATMFYSPTKKDFWACYGNEHVVIVPVKATDSLVYVAILTAEGGQFLVFDRETFDELDFDKDPGLVKLEESYCSKTREELKKYLRADDT